MKALALDLGGVHAACAVVEDRTLVVSERIALRESTNLSCVLPRVSECLKRLLQDCGMQASECSGVAVSFCGIVSPHPAQILSTLGKYVDGPGLDLPLWAKNAFGIPIVIENDARMALLGEWYAGSVQGFEDAVMMTLGTGIGGAAMVGGRLLRGKHFQAGCLGGHLTVAYGGRQCKCGNIGCAEAEASTWALPAICREWPGFESSSLARENVIDFAVLFRHAKAGDRVACEVRDRCLRVWSSCAVSMAHAYSPEVIALGGGVMESASEILPVIEPWVHEHVWSPWGLVQVRRAKLGEKAALLGAVPLLQTILQ